VLVFKPHKKAVYELAFSPDGRVLATSAREEPARLWDLDGPTEVKQFPASGYYRTIAFSPNGRYFAHGGDLRVWELESGSCVVEAGHARSIAFSPDGKEVAIADMGSAVLRWALPTGAPVDDWNSTYAKDRDDWEPTGALTYAPDGKTIAMLGTGRGWGGDRILLWGRKTGKPRLEIAMDFGGAHPATIVYSPNGTVIAGAYGPILGVVNAKTGAKVAALKPGRKSFSACAFAPDGKRLIATHYDATIHVYDTATWTELTGYEWQIGKLTAVAVAPDGLRAACGSERGRVVVWDLEV
jgi:WD40 repeat protein